MKVEKIWAELSAKAQEVAQESTELSEVKVELGLVEDFEKLFNQALDSEGAVTDALIDALGKAENKYKSVISDFERAVKVGEEAEASAKELGVDLPSVFQNKVETARRSIKEAQGMLSKISQMYSAF
jgi:hypothetical protein